MSFDIYKAKKLYEELLSIPRDISIYLSKSLEFLDLITKPLMSSKEAGKFKDYESEKLSMMRSLTKSLGYRGGALLIKDKNENGEELLRIEETVVVCNGSELEKKACEEYRRALKPKTRYNKKKEKKIILSSLPPDHSFLRVVSEKVPMQIMYDKDRDLWFRQYTKTISGEKLIEPFKISGKSKQTTGSDAEEYFQLLLKERKNWFLKVVFADAPSFFRSLFIPLNIADEVIGIINFDNPIDPEEKYATDEKKLELFSIVSQIYQLGFSIMYLEKKTAKTVLHTENAMTTTLGLARHMRLSDIETKILYYSAMLHDIGKLGYDYIVNKDSLLSIEERRIMEQHPLYGADVLRKMKIIPEQIIEIVESHHELRDGTGYPLGKRKKKVSTLSEIMKVVDSFTAQTEGRSYRRFESLPVEPCRELYLLAVEELKRCSMQDFDKKLWRKYYTQAKKPSEFNKKGEPVFHNYYDPYVVRMLERYVHEDILPLLR